MSLEIENISAYLNGVFRFSHKAMAAVLELVICSDNEKYAESAAWEVFKETDHLEQILSKFIPSSDVSKINNSAIGDKIILSEEMIFCLKGCSKLFDLTEGSFDINFDANSKLLKIGQLYEFNSGDKEGYSLILDESGSSVIRTAGNCSLNLGGYGKGFALDKAGEILKEWGVDSAFLSFGSSSVKAIGSPPDSNGWKISISNPADAERQIMNFKLCDISVSASGIAKKDHIFDPFTGKPLTDAGGSWAFSTSAAESDGLSTAFLILDNERVSMICDKKKNLGGIKLPQKNKLVKADIQLFGTLPDYEFLL